MPVAQDYGDFPITKCPTRAAQGLTGKNAPSVKRIMKEIIGAEALERNAVRKADLDIIRGLMNGQCVGTDSLTGQRNSVGEASSSGNIFTGPEVDKLRRMLGREVRYCTVLNSQDPSRHGNDMRDALGVMEQRGKKIDWPVFGRRYYELKIGKVSVVMVRHVEGLPMLSLVWSA